ncbi:MAG TPA: hypothetical protein VIM67_01985, partial [Terriglobus sp.]
MASARTLRCFSLPGMLLLSVSAVSQMALIPTPREAAPVRSLPLSQGINIVCSACDASDSFAANELSRQLRESGVTVATSSSVRITLLRTTSEAGRQALASAHVTWSPEMQEEGYAIVP